MLKAKTCARNTKSFQIYFGNMIRNKYPLLRLFLVWLMKTWTYSCEQIRACFENFCKMIGKICYENMFYFSTQSSLTRTSSNDVPVPLCYQIGFFNPSNMVVDSCCFFFFVENRFSPIKTFSRRNKWKKN